jgi:AmmeMemoRadiSam system protein B
MRNAAVAGRFYPGDPAELSRVARGYLGAAVAEDAIAVVAPHAGYVYSGGIAGETYARVRVPERAIVLCPNHTGWGSPRSVWTRGAWRIPGATIGVDEVLADAVVREAALVPDDEAHLQEHAIEVHLPFLHERQPRLEIVPICLGTLSLEACERVGRGIARAVTSAASRVLLVASTDMSHYVPASRARAMDELALSRVLALDPAGLHRVVQSEGLTMCGYIPTTVTLFAALELGASRVDLVRYGNSGETSGDYDRVVGYAGLVVR